MRRSYPTTNRRYREYLNSPEWKAKRKAVLKRSGGICERCRRYLVDEVHHLTYANVLDEPLEDLQGLYKPCHGFLHQESGVDPLAESVYVKVSGYVMEYRQKGTWKYRRIKASKLDQFKASGHFNDVGKYLVPLSVFLDEEGNPVLDPSRWTPYRTAYGGRGRPIPPDPAEVQKRIEQLKQRRSEEERRRQELPGSFTSFQDKTPKTAKEVKTLFRKHPRIVDHGHDCKILSVRTTKTMGVALDVQFENGGAWYRYKIYDAEVKLDEGAIVLDHERGTWVRLTHRRLFSSLA